MMEVEEESSHGTLVGFIAAYDPDIGDNALIDYIITGILIYLIIQISKIISYDFYNINFRW